MLKDCYIFFYKSNIKEHVQSGYWLAGPSTIALVTPTVFDEKTLLSMLGIPLVLHWENTKFVGPPCQTVPAYNMQLKFLAEFHCSSEFLLN